MAYSNITGIAAVFEGGVLVLALLTAWLLGIPLLAQLTFEWRAVWLSAAVACSLFLLLVWSTRSQWKVLTRLFREVEDQVVPLFAACSVLEFAVISVLAGVAEEALFRGVLQTALADWIHPYLALLLASALFGLAHFITPTYALVAAVIGLCLGSLLMVSDNLLAPMLTHAVYDFLALVYLVRRYKVTAV